MHMCDIQENDGSNIGRKHITSVYKVPKRHLRIRRINLNSSQGGISDPSGLFKSLLDIVYLPTR